MQYGFMSKILRYVLKTKSPRVDIHILILNVAVLI